VFTWGFDDDGRNGHGAPGHQLLPKRVDALVGRVIVDVSCGCWHSAALCSEGRLYTWGSCKSG
jgi:alpha-tubulin suppressor-like RCC1 family protein